MTARFLCLLAILTYVTTGPKGGEGFQDTVSHVSAACLMSEALHGVPNSVKVFKTSAAANVLDASKAREGCQDAVRRAEDAFSSTPKVEEAVGRARAALKEAESAENAAKTALSDVEQYAANASALANNNVALVDDYLKSVAEDNSAASTARRIARDCNAPLEVSSWVLTQAVESGCAVFMTVICNTARTRMADLRAEYDQLEAAVRRASEARVAARAAESNAHKAAEEAERTAETEKAKVKEVPKKDPEGKVEISDDDHVQELGDDEGEEAEVGNDGSYAESIGGYTLLILLAALSHSAAAHF
ncbi:hypothetical protein, conserved [Trypanosoma brucei brucei TREU927]|uniref:Trypanosoma glutamic acid/alanine-rich protein domain-containing protein n=1 Tax=Trypanosoma brucei brucei (strain 927/4 GUTat10.1) TaxID=185431 RepID=Q57U12_TRYB2|nr:hypothetical protein, conserved [Trypanosoma brucei brucei TREU927]AAX70906.1 hypothetical protein, conserved [Trypanosoma brucei]AAZ12107.1 hypothetical protein, conserved [Trypanosoma brucei brucei TREU927]